MKKQKYVLAAVLLMAAMTFSACSAAAKNDKDSSVGTSTPSISENHAEHMPVSYNDTVIMYSNLADADAQAEVVNTMQDHGITKEQTDTFIEWVNDFNKRAQSPLAEGFEEMTEPEVDYSTVVFQPKELADGTILPEANCRLTSFLLIRNNIQTDKIADDSDTYLMFDTEAIEAAEQFQSHKDKIDDYKCLYNWISMDGLTTMEEHIRAVEQAWQDRGIQIDSTDGVSIINVYIHSVFENVRIVGHTGVLFDEGDKLLFVEKYGPEAPFHAAWFHNRAELERYVLARKDLYADEEELDPIVMENGQVLKTE